ncbi:hypothetical protein PQX77_021339 [Marasmius sp. AFHP31]|nr:hypothetical protein PQX77_021339 [Marasmius sp. AFHP31]
MAEPLPYNLTIASQTASLLYYPPRGSDTKASDGWELVYPSVDLGPGQRQGRGADSHKSTKAEASVTFNWHGTAIYVYGTGRKESYRFSVDGQDVGQTFDVQQGGLLGSMTGMQYKEHNATLKVVGGEGLAFQYADLTIGLGYPGNEKKNQTIQAVIEDSSSIQPNPFFVFKNDSQGWAPDTYIATITFPNGTKSSITREMVTIGRNDGLRFNVTSSNAFILWGSPNAGHPVKRATISPRPGSSDLTSTKDTFIFDIGRYLDFQQILYWEGGLDRETVYTVEISPFVDQQKTAFNELQLLDGGPPSRQPVPPTTVNEEHRRHLAARYIAVIVVIPILILAAIGAGALWFQKRAKQRRAARVTVYDVNFDDAPLPQPSSTVSRPSREVDGGPLPPQYDHAWASAPMEGGNVPSTPAPRTASAVPNGRGKLKRFGRNEMVRYGIRADNH